MNKTDPALFAHAFGSANLQNVRDAAGIIGYGKGTDSTMPEIVAAAIRFGYHEGKRESKVKIRELCDTVHSLKMKQRETDDTAEEMLNNPDILRKMIAEMTGRLAALEAKTGKAVDPAAADQRGDTDSDVNTPTVKREV